ncbi:hypothetical protein Tco_0544817 [Tanacetum coccineum]
MPLSDKTILGSHCFVHELKKEMHDDLEYVQNLEKEMDELESEKADFSNIYDLLLEECVSKDVTCSYLHSMSDLNAHTELKCLYLHKVKECECLALKLSKQTESVNNEVHNKLLKSFAKQKTLNFSELSLQHCKEQMKKHPFETPIVIAPAPLEISQSMSHIVTKGKSSSNDMVHNNYLEKDKKSAQLQNDQEENENLVMIDPSRLPKTLLKQVQSSVVNDKLASAENNHFRPRSSLFTMALIAQIKPLVFNGNDCRYTSVQPRSTTNGSSDHNRSELGIQDHSNEQSSSKLVPKVVP